MATKSIPGTLKMTKPKFTTILCTLLVMAVLLTAAAEDVFASVPEFPGNSSTHIEDGPFQQDPDPTPTAETSPTRPAGRGEGLILIASIIVLIILTGIIFATRRRR
jgi:hypothetical protein